MIGFVARRKVLLFTSLHDWPGCLRFAHARSLCASGAADRVRYTAKSAILLCSSFAPRTTLPPVAKALRPWIQTGEAPAPTDVAQILGAQGALSGDRRTIFHAIAADPNTQSKLGLDEISAMTDELFEALADSIDPRFSVN